MRFSRGFRVTPYEVTNRKRAAVVRRQRLDREKFPLFAAEIAEGQDDPDEVLADRAIWIVERQRAQRSKRAADWLRARTILRLLSDDKRAAFLRFWNRSKFPADPTYLISALRGFALGEYILHEGEIVSAANLKWEQATRAKFAAMTDAELDHMIQTHISPLFAEWGREERRRRFEVRSAEAPAPIRRKARRR